MDKEYLEHVKEELKFARYFYLGVISVLVLAIGALCYEYLAETSEMEGYIKELRTALEQCRT